MNNALINDTKRKFITVGYYFLFLGLGVSSSLMGPALLSLTHQTNSTLREIGVIFLLSPIGFIAGSRIGGQIYDRISGHKPLILAILIIALSRFLLPFSPTVLTVSILVFISGISVGIAEVGCNTLLGWLYGNKVDTFLNGLHIAFGLGSFSGLIFVAWMIQLGVEIPKVFWLASIILLFTAFYISLFPSPSIPIERFDSDLVIRTNNSGILFQCGFLLFFAAGVEATLGSWLFTFVITRNLVVEITASFLNAVFWGTFALGRLSALPLVARGYSWFVIRICYLACLVGLLFLVPVIPIFTWIGVICLGFFLGPIFPNLLTLSQKTGAVTGRTTGKLFAASGVGTMSLPWVVSQVFEQKGPLTMIFLASSCLIISMIIITRIDASHQRVSISIDDEEVLCKLD